MPKTASRAPVLVPSMKKEGESKKETPHWLGTWAIDEAKKPGWGGGFFWTGKSGKRGDCFEERRKQEKKAPSFGQKGEATRSTYPRKKGLRVVPLRKNKA